MYSKANVSDLDAVLATDYYDMPERAGKSDTRLIKPLGDAIGTERMKPNIWLYPAGASMGGHKQEEQEELYHVLDGRVTFTVEDERFSAETGDIVVVDPDAWRRVTAHEDSVILIVGAPSVENDGVPQPERSE